MLEWSGKDSETAIGTMLNEVTKKKCCDGWKNKKSQQREKNTRTKQNYNKTKQ